MIAIVLIMKNERLEISKLNYTMNCLIVYNDVITVSKFDE